MQEDMLAVLRHPAPCRDFHNEALRTILPVEVVLEKSDPIRISAQAPTRQMVISSPELAEELSPQMSRVEDMRPSLDLDPVNTEVSTVCYRPPR